MKRLFAILLAFCLLLSLTAGSAAAEEKQHNYSTEVNSGIRHEVCTTLLGTSASAYYTGEYTYATLSALESDDLLQALRTLTKSTHDYTSSYNNCRDMAVATDCENGDGVSISLIYTSYSATASDWCNDRTEGWNREHVWPKSLGGYGNSGPGADLHHVRPSDQLVNSTRGNKKYGNVSDGSTVKGVYYTGYAVGGRYNSTYFEPLDNVKGDVARICLYMYVRYGADSSYTCGSLTTVFQSIDVLLEWCALDPVDTWEMGRNEVVADFQGNRNVFIDYPELAWLLFDREIPASMTTPSKGMSETVCTHSKTTVKNASAATCTEPGYTGDTYCADCGEKLSSGKTIAAKGHTNRNADNICDTCGAEIPCGHGKTELRNEKEATCTQDGYSGDLFCVYCDLLVEAGISIHPTGVHSYGQWTVTKEATQTQTGIRERSCSVCGHTEAEVIPVLEPTPTDPTPTDPDPSDPTADQPASSSPAQTEETQNNTTEATASIAGQPNQATPSSSSLWIILVVIAAAACVLIFLFIGKDKKEHLD